MFWLRRWFDGTNLATFGKLSYYLIFKWASCIHSVPWKRSLVFKQTDGGGKTCILTHGSQPIRLHLARLWKCFPVMCAQYASDCGCAVSHTENILQLAYLRSPNIKPGYEKVLLHWRNYSHLLQVQKWQMGWKTLFISFIYTRKLQEDL